MAALTSGDEIFAEAIHAWVHLQISDEDLVDRMTQLAVSYRETGATIDETCEWVHYLVTSWLRHLSTEAGPPQLRLVPRSTEGLQ